MSADPHAFATLLAEQIVRGARLDSLPIDPIAFARAKDIEVVAKPASQAGVSGILVRHGNFLAIGYATHLNEGFQNFSVAHELGHIHLPGHVDAVIPGGSGEHHSRAGFESKDRYEMEADRFAAGFLMPRHLFFPALERAGQGLVAIESLARSAERRSTLPPSATSNAPASQ